MNNPSFHIAFSYARDAETIANSIRPFLTKLGITEVSLGSDQEELKTKLIKQYRDADLILVLITKSYSHADQTVLEWELIHEEWKARDKKRCFFVRIHPFSPEGVSDVLTAVEWKGCGAEVAVEVFAGLARESDSQKVAKPQAGQVSNSAEKNYGNQGYVINETGRKQYFHGSRED